jgi:hypothetical protein
MIDLGTNVRDKITGFEGVVMARTQYINGCDRYAVQAQELHEGKPVDWVHFDENQLEVIPKPSAPVKLDKTAPGGPRPAPKPRGVF